MKGKGLIRISGAMLIIMAFLTLVFLFMAKLSFSPPGVATEKWYYILKLSIPLYMISGIALFTFTEWSIKLAIVSYAVALSHIVFTYVETYRFAMFYKEKFELFGGAGPIIFIILIIALFFITRLFLLRGQFEDKKDTEKKVKNIKLAIEATIIIAILTPFVSGYISVINLLYKEYQGQAEAKGKITLVTSRINNDQRFKKVRFFVDPRGYPMVTGVVMDEEDWQALEELLRSYKFLNRLGGWVHIDNGEIIGSHLSRDIHPVILVNIGSIEKNYRDQVVSLLNKNSIANYLQDSEYFPNSCYIYVSPAKREQAMVLLKQTSILGDKYSSKSYHADTIKYGNETFVNIGFIEMSHRGHVLGLLYKNSINNFLKNAQYPGYNVFHIYVPPAKREQAINLLKQDSILGEEYCSKE